MSKYTASVLYVCTAIVLVAVIIGMTKYNMDQARHEEEMARIQASTHPATMPER